MEILKTDTNSKQEHITNKETISTLLDEILLICKNDNRIFDNKKLVTLEVQENELKEKIVKQERLINDSRNIERDLELRLNETSEFISSKRNELLRLLGSE